MPSDVDCEKLAWLCLAGNSFKAFLHYQAGTIAAWQMLQLHCLACVKPRGVYSPVVKEPAFLIYWSRLDYAHRPL